MLPEKLQTSPYLTCVRQGERSPVVYMTDTLGPEYPEMGDPCDAKFGVIDLDRKVIWERDEKVLTALQSAAAKPIQSRELVQQYGEILISDLVQRKWLKTPKDLCSEYRLYSGEIEITAHCNWGCSFCPVSVTPKTKEIMPMSLFTEIIKKLSDHNQVRYVTFHFFNEPTLDPFFIDRLEVLRKNNLKLALYTNASALTPKKIQGIIDSGVMYHLIVNLPSLNEDEFNNLTGSRTYKQSLHNFEFAVQAKQFPVSLSVNGVGDDLQRNVARLKTQYEPYGVEVNASDTCDRAGTLSGEYAQNIYVDGRLRGCNWPVNHAYFSVRGELFICCNDYHQREVYGHINDGSLHDVMSSPKAIQIRQRVFGVEDAPANYICRTCHDQKLDFANRQFRPLATFPLSLTAEEKVSRREVCDNG